MAPLLVSAAGVMITRMPERSSTASIDFRPDEHRWSGKNPRLPTMTASVTGRVAEGWARRAPATAAGREDASGPRSESALDVMGAWRRAVGNAVHRRCTVGHETASAEAGMYAMTPYRLLVRSGRPEEATAGRATPVPGCAERLPQWDVHGTSGTSGTAVGFLPPSAMN
jgi:hypothetical protein